MCVKAGKNQLVKPPPHPEFRAQDYLEALEERYRQSIVTDYQRSIQCRPEDLATVSTCAMCLKNAPLVTFLFYF